MYRSAKPIFLFLLHLQFCAGVKRSYEWVLESERIDEKYDIVGPEAILRGDLKFEDSVQEQCAQQLRMLRMGIETRESWALKMLDSSSRLPSGIFKGNIIDFGNFDECVELKEKASENLEINGHHCMYSIQTNITEKFIPFYPMLSLCVPLKCTAKDIMNLIDDLTDDFSHLKERKLKVLSVRCTENKEVTADAELSIYFIIMSAYIGILIFCTIGHLWSEKVGSKNEIFKTLSYFSFVKNIRSIMSMETHDGDIPIIHGIRALSTLWLIIVHEYFFNFFAAMTNFLDMIPWFTKFWTILIPLMGLYSVDTLLVLSGFLTAYIFLQQLKKNSFNLSRYYIHRFMRITPSVAIIVYSGIVLGTRFGTGPRMEWLREIFLDGCRTKWWSYFFYIPNFVETDNYCLTHLWSIAVDMQLIATAPFILYLLNKWKNVGLTFLATLIVMSVVIYGYILGVNGYSAIYITLEPSIPVILESFNNIYTKPYTRASPWLLGVLCGYIITNQTSKPTKRSLITGWILAIGAFAFCVFGTKSFTREDYEYNMPWEIIFGVLSKPAWGFGISWIVYASLNDFAGPIAKLLSLKIFLPLSRISFSMCLVHLVFPFAITGTSRTTRYFHDYLIWHSYIGNLVLSIVASFLFSITFEWPMRNWEKFVFSKKKKKNDITDQQKQMTEHKTNTIFKASSVQTKDYDKKDSRTETKL